MTDNYTLSDIAAVTGGNRNNDGWGDGNSWWIILFLIFGMFGWGGFGGNGWGGNSGGGQGGYDTRADFQRGFDNQAVIGKLDGITQGICDSTYALNNAITNGFHGVDSALCNLGYQTQQGFNQTNIALMQGQNALATQLANCCCENREAIAGVRYDMATQACETRNIIQNTTRDILDSNNANTRAILDFLTQDKIATLTAENQNLKLAASQANQNAVLQAAMDANTAEIIRRTGNDCPVPAYVVQPPTQVAFPVNACNTFTGFNYGNGCNC